MFNPRQRSQQHSPRPGPASAPTNGAFTSASGHHWAPSPSVGYFNGARHSAASTHGYPFEFEFAPEQDDGHDDSYYYGSEFEFDDGPGGGGGAQQPQQGHGFRSTVGGRSFFVPGDPSRLQHRDGSVFLDGMYMGDSD